MPHGILNMNLLSFAHNDDNHAAHKVVIPDGNRGDHANVHSLHVS